MVCCGAALKVRFSSGTQPYHKVLNNVFFQNKSVDGINVTSDLNIVLI